jgi:dihydroxyacid dehydratase/phosphogluconate dehydratase
MTEKIQKSKQIRKNWVQFDTLCCGTGWDEDDLKNPQIMVEDDDLLSIDIPGRNLNIVGHADRRMDSAEVQSLLAERKKKWKAPPILHPRGVLKRYTSQAVSAIKGAYLG